MNTLDARSALQAKQSAEAQLARAAKCPPWRHAVFGLMMGALVASPALDLAIRLPLVGLVLLMVPVLIQSDRKRMGMFINGYRRGRTRVVAIGMVVVELALYAVSAFQGLARHDQVTPLLLGIAGAAVGVLGSVLWQRVFVRELGA